MAFEGLELCDGKLSLATETDVLKGLRKDKAAGEICAVTVFNNLDGGLSNGNDKGCLQMNCVY